MKYVATAVIAIAIGGCLGEPGSQSGEPVAVDDCANPGLVDSPRTVTQFVAQANDFGCMIEAAQADAEPQDRWYRVRNFYMKNSLGQTQSALDVACGRIAGPYPQGTIVQLIPFEAMVKRGGEYNPEANGWEFFFMQPDTDPENPGGFTTEILVRGATETENSFGGNCFSCHQQAQADADFLCESSNGCDPIPNAGSAAEAFRLGDARCQVYLEDQADE